MLAAASLWLTILPLCTTIIAFPNLGPFLHVGNPLIFTLYTRFTHRELYAGLINQLSGFIREPWGVL